MLTGPNWILIENQVAPGILAISMTCRTHWSLNEGLLRELNPGPLAPGARIIPLDQAADGRSQKTKCPCTALAEWSPEVGRPWVCLGSPGGAWVLPGCSWVPLGVTGCPWVSLGVPGCSWVSLEDPGCSGVASGCPWGFPGVPGCPLVSLGVPGCPWVSLGVLGGPGCSWVSLGA